MAAEEVLASDRRTMSALLFIAASTNVVDVFSAVNSSPWTAQSFGGDPEKAESCRRYVRHAMVIAGAYSVTAAWIARSWWPIVGAVAAEAYMWYLYEEALGKAAETGSTDWES